MMDRKDVVPTIRLKAFTRDVLSLKWPTDNLIDRACEPQLDQGMIWKVLLADRIRKHF